MEETAKVMVLTLSVIVELLAAFIISIGLLQFLRGYLPNLVRKDHHMSNAWLRVKFGSSLTLALELLLAADVLQTAVAPTWDDIGKLGAIAAIRTALNYFLEKELREIEKRELKETPLTTRE
jgi:uncharacterized membrane protein